jgi:hypothetical protein
MLWAFSRPTHQQPAQNRMEIDQLGGFLGSGPSTWGKSQGGTAQWGREARHSTSVLNHSSDKVGRVEAWAPCHWRKHHRQGHTLEDELPKLSRPGEGTPFALILSLLQPVFWFM